MNDIDNSCPSCGGSGGGPFGRPGSAWDVETYVCPRCAGVGVIRADTGSTPRLAKAKAEPASRPKPGFAVTRAPSAVRKRRSSTS
ncbi:MAG: hypothetical protein FWD17_07045 [Polyangiaceae bacterium]|nr:hypothetical protein [Polyangiaceae bacterium]